MKAIIPFFLLLIFIWKSEVSFSQCDAANFQVLNIVQPDPCPTGGAIDVQIPGGISCATDNWFAVLTPSVGAPSSIIFPENGGPITFSSLESGSYSVSVTNGVITYQWSGNPVVLTTSYVPMSITTSSTTTSCPNSSPNVADDATLTVNVGAGTGVGPFFYSIDGGVQTFGPTTSLSHTFSGLSPGSHVVTIQDQIAPGCFQSQTQNPVIPVNNLPSLASVLPVIRYRKIGCPTDCNKYIVSGYMPVGPYHGMVYSNPDTSRAMISVNGAPYVELSSTYSYVYGFSDTLYSGDTFTFQFSDGCDTIYRSGTVPSNNLTGVSLNQGVSIDSCSMSYYIRAQVAWQNACTSALMTVELEDPLNPGFFSPISGSPFSMGGITNNVSLMFYTDTTLVSGNYRVTIDDGCSSITDFINITDAYSNYVNNLSNIPLRHGKGTLLDNSDAFSMQLGGGLLYPLTVSFMPSSGATSITYTAAEPFNLAGTYTANFPYVMTVPDFWGGSVVDLPSNTTYDVTITDNCGNSVTKSFTTDSATYDPIIDVSVDCANSSSVSWDLQSPDGDYTITGTIYRAQWRLHYDDGFGGPGAIVPGVGYESATNGGADNYKSRTLYNLASGDYVLRFYDFGTGPLPSMVTPLNFDQREYHMPFTVPDYAPVGVSVSGTFCDLTDLSSGFILADIASGTPVYPLTWELLDGFGTVLQTYTADSSTAVNAVQQTFTGLNVGNYSVRVTTPCDQTSAVFTLAGSGGVPSVSASDMDLCPVGDSVTLGLPLPSSLYDITWEDNLGNVVGTGTPISVDVTATTTYTATFGLVPGTPCGVGTPTYQSDVTIVLQDTVPPMAVCQDMTVYLDGTGSVSISATDIDGGSTDNCGIESLTLSQTVFDCSHVGTNSVTLIVTDSLGNASTCNATVTVEDTISPTVVCQNITVYLDAMGNTSIVSGDIDNGSTDNCGIASMVVTPSTFDCSNVGSNAVTLAVTDVNGNVGTCNATVTVEDTIAPTALCQDITIQLDASGNVSIVAGDIDGGSTDNCGIASIAASQTSFDCSMVGANTVTLTVTDVNGNVSTCTSTVTVEDNVAPTALCQDITVQLDAAGNASIVAADIDGGSSDNCGIASLVASQTSFDCSMVGANTVTLTVTDVNGNVSTCTSTVTVEDNVAPTVVCQDITVQLDAAGNTSIVAADIDGGSTDNCGIASIAASQTSFDCSMVGANTITLTVTDVNGNVSTCTSTVTVEDTIAPTALCQDITIQLDASGNASIVAGDIDGGSTDNCGIASIAASQTSFDCSMVGSNTVTLTVTDVNGNVSTCTSTVTVEDNVAPTALCQDITIHLDAVGNVSIVAADIDGGSTDNCGIASLVASQTSFDCSMVGSNTVTLTVTDVNGNVSTCNATVTVEDTIAPTVVCQDITVQLDAAGNTSIVAADIDGGSTDNCGIASMAASQTSFDCSMVGANAVTLTVTDVNGNLSTCNATVTVEDMIAPTALCQDITVQLNAVGNASIVAADIDGGSSDNCGIASVAASQTSFDCSMIGANAVTLTVTDVNGNVTTCSSTVTVEDTIAPIIISCHSDTLVAISSGQCEAVVPDFTSSSSIVVTDNCSVQGGDILISQLPLAGSVVEQDTAIWLFVEDSSGNVDSCSFLMSIIDQTSPTIVNCVQDTLMALDANCELMVPDFSNGFDFQVTDNCTEPSAIQITQTPEAGVTIYTDTIVWMFAYDASGNLDSCSLNLSVYDNTAPEVNCIDDQYLLLDEDCSAALPDYTEVGFGLVTIDNCDIYDSNLVVTQVPSPGTIVSEQLEVWVYAQDAFGNLDSCSFMVTPENCEVIIYEAFSPEKQDGKNDVFFVEGLHQFPGSSVLIYNRWGTQVFESSDYQNDWNGQSQSNLNVNGDQLPEGTYYYVLTLGGSESNELHGKVYRGYVYLKR